MVHAPALPGTPLYDERSGMSGIIDRMRSDLEILVPAGFDGLLFCNEGDRPYTFEAGYSGVAAMARIVAELCPRGVPYGVDFLWDAMAALSVAAATDATFVREVMTGTYESDMGVWNTRASDVLRERRRLSADRVAMFMNITPEFASVVGRRGSGQIALSVMVSSLPDALLVSGPMAGAEPTGDVVSEVKNAVGEEFPVLVNTGVKSTNVASFLKIADGIIVGSDLKRDGYTWNPVDPDRVKRFLAAAGR
jgi:membrane complex biogenesis BtpA family protein